MATYSLGITGARNASVPLVETEVIDDAYATTGGMQYAMMRGLPFVSKGPDGQLHTRTFDAERWRPDIPVLKPSPR